MTIRTQKTHINEKWPFHTFWWLRTTNMPHNSFIMPTVYYNGNTTVCVDMYGYPMEEYSINSECSISVVCKI